MISRTLRILEQFTVERSVLPADWLVNQLGVSRASIYRDIHELVDTGLLEKVDGRGYALGTRIVELDRLIRLCDPLLAAADTLPQKLAEEAGGTVLLCRLHARKVLCILQATSVAHPLAVSYERGRAMPLYRGATSKILLAFVSTAWLQDLVTDDRAALAQAGLPQSLAALQEHLAPMRARGYAMTRGEVDQGAVGIAVPLLDGERLLGSLSVVMPASRSSPSTEKRALSLLMSCVHRIEGRLEGARNRERASRALQSA